MRHALIVAVMGMAAVAAAQTLQPLNAKTGQWQMAETTTWTGVPPQFAAALQSGTAHNYKSCVTAKDLSSNPWANGSRDQCVWRVLSSTGTDMDVQGTACDMGKQVGMTAEVRGTIHLLDAENGTGSFTVTLTGNGQTMNGQAVYTGRWIGPTCAR